MGLANPIHQSLVRLELGIPPSRRARPAPAAAASSLLHLRRLARCRERRAPPRIWQRRQSGCWPSARNAAGMAAPLLPIRLLFFVRGERGSHGRSSPPDSPPLLRARRPLQLLVLPSIHPAPLVFLLSQIGRRPSPWFQIGAEVAAIEEQGRARPGAPPAARATLVIFSYPRKQRAEA